MSKPFSLKRHQVPEPPPVEVWADWLRWLVVVMNYNDPQLHFAASLLSQALSRGHLTDRQIEAAIPLLERVLDAYQRGDLFCMKEPAVTSPCLRLEVDNTRGEA